MVKSKKDTSKRQSEGPGDKTHNDTSKPNSHSAEEIIQFTGLQKGLIKPPRKDQLTKFKVPETDLKVDDRIMNLTANLAGIKASDISLSLTSDSLVILGKNKQAAYYTDIKLPENIIPQSAMAKLKDGILYFDAQKLNDNLPWNGLAQLESLGAELQNTKERLAQFQEQYHTIQLEYQNLMVKNKNEVENRVDCYKLSVIEKLLKSIDNFELALNSASMKKSKDVERIIIGINFILTELKNIIIEEGVIEIPTNGMVLNPNLHDVMETEETDKVAENTILAEFQKGYQYKNRIIRPSKVRVAVAPAPEDKSKSKIKTKTKPETSAKAKK